MMGNDCIDISLKNIWQSWFAFRKGKKPSKDIDEFQFYLEENLFQLFRDLNTGRYQHGGYKKFIVCDNKRREISVADVRDRVVHRLIYNFLEKLYDKTFIFDAWSCRIGNLTSQIFANIYLNELDRFVKHTLKVKAYVRYGDDFIVIETDLNKIHNIRFKTIEFLAKELKLQTNSKSDKIVKASHGLKFLGVKLWAPGRDLNKRSKGRIQSRLRPNNVASYSGLVKQHCGTRETKKFHWTLYEKVINE